MIVPYLMVNENDGFFSEIRVRDPAVYPPCADGAAGNPEPAHSCGDFFYDVAALEVEYALVVFAPDPGEEPVEGRDGP